MTVQELKTILTYAEIDPEQKVYVNITLKDGHKTVQDIKTFNVFSDAIALNVKID